MADKPETLSEQELKTALRSAWKKHEKLAKVDMGPLLYWLRTKLRAQGTRNDISDQDRGFGAWVEDNLAISRRTADRWADEYAISAGLKTPTSSQVSTSSEDDFYTEELEKHGSLVMIKNINYWVRPRQHAQYTQAMRILKTHFKATNEKEAIFKGVLYVADTIARGTRTGVEGKLGASHVAKGKSQPRVQTGHVEGHHRANGHRRRKGPRADKTVTGRKAFRAAAG
jgi:hypothetical protein